MSGRLCANVWLFGSVGKAILDAAGAIRDAGHNVTLYSGEDCLGHHWDMHRGAPDVIVILSESVAGAQEWHCQLPVMATIGTMIVAGRSARDREQALRAGFADCLSLPFSAVELGLRVDSLIRRDRSVGIVSGSREVSWCGYTLNRRDRRLRRADGTVVHLTETEVGILGELLESGGDVTERRRLARGARFLASSRSVDVHIANIRSKLRRAGVGGLKILAVRHVGYRLIAESSEDSGQASKRRSDERRYAMPVRLACMGGWQT